MKTIQPVLMIPLRRCGSHAIRLRLSFNSDFYSPYPLHLVDFMPLVPLYGDLNDDENYFRMTIDLIGLLDHSLVKWEGVVIEPIAFFEKIKSLPRSVHTVAWEIILEAGRIHDAKVVMDKSLDNVHYWKELLPLYPNLLFLNLVRDPRAQVSSMNRAVIHEFESVLNAQILARSFQVAKELMETHPDRVLTVRYEDFINDQDTALKKICKFFGISFLEEMLDVSHSEEARRISKQSALWTSNALPPVPANIDKFKASMLPEEIEAIETICGEMMDRYQYQRMSPAKFTVTEAVVEEARKRSAEKRAEYWKIMRIDNPKDYFLRRRRADYLEMCKHALKE